MAQFDVCRIRGGGLVVDCQSDLLSALPTRFVAPLRANVSRTIDRLNPVFRIDGHDYAMVAQLAGAIDRRALIETIASLADRDHDVKAALDMLVIGF